jgi:hypothetical protein
MRKQDVVRTVNSMIFRPGWQLSAEPMGFDDVWVRFVVQTVDTSYPSTGGTYNVPKTLDTGFRLDVTEVNSVEQLTYKILQMAHEFDVHEDRELLRVLDGDGRYSAPLHPHRAEGNEAWDLLERRLPSYSYR